MKNTSPCIVLASASPRRHELLLQIGVAHEVLPMHLDESRLPGEPAQEFVERLARDKAEAGFRAGKGDLPVLGADTIVVVDEVILAKPASREESIAMHSLLSGRAHEVMTAVAITNGAKTLCRTSCSKVFFRQLSLNEMHAYWDSGEPADKAGGYGIQGLAAQFIERLEGSYSGVMGLPLFETAQLLQEFGIELLSRD